MPASGLTCAFSLRFSPKNLMQTDSLPMTDTEFTALVRLLEDTDPEVQKAITARLFSLGLQAVPRLEAAWENESDEIQQDRIAEIIGQIQFRTYADALLEWKSAPKQDLLTGWLLVTRIQFPDVQEDAYRKQINRLVHRIWIDIQGKFHVPEKLLVVNRMLFQLERFQGSVKVMNEPNAFYLNGLLDTRKGSPLSLAFLYQIVCQELEIPLAGVVIPGYCALKFEHPEQEFFIDVFNKGAFFLRSDLEKYLDSIQQEKHEIFFTGISHVQMIREMILLLAAAHERKKEVAKASLFRKLHQFIENE